MEELFDVESVEACLPVPCNLLLANRTATILVDMCVDFVDFCLRRRAQIFHLLIVCNWNGLVLFVFNNFSFGLGFDSFPLFSIFDTFKLFHDFFVSVARFLDCLPERLEFLDTNIAILVSVHGLEEALDGESCETTPPVSSDFFDAYWAISVGVKSCKDCIDFLLSCSA